MVELVLTWHVVYSKYSSLKSSVQVLQDIFFPSVGKQTITRSLEQYSPRLGSHNKFLMSMSMADMASMAMSTATAPPQQQALHLSDEYGHGRRRVLQDLCKWLMIVSI